MGRQGETFTSREYFTMESQSLDSKQSQSPGRHSAPASLPEQLNFTPFVRALQEKHLRGSHRGPGCGHARRAQVSETWRCLDSHEDPHCSGFSPQSRRELNSDLFCLQEETEKRRNMLPKLGLIFLSQRQHVKKVQSCCIHVLD